MYFSVSPTDDTSDFCIFGLNSISRKIFQAAVLGIKAQPKETISSEMLTYWNSCFTELYCFFVVFFCCCCYCSTICKSIIKDCSCDNQLNISILFTQPTMLAVVFKEKMSQVISWKGHVDTYFILWNLDVCFFICKIR